MEKINESALEGAKLLANEKESNYDDDIEWEDLDYESSEIASVTTGSTEGSKYLFDNCEKTEILTPCALLYIADNQVQRCSNYKQKTQRPLAQLVGSWEVDSKALESVKNDNKKLYALGVCGSHYSFDQNVLHDPNHKSLHCIDESWIYCHRYLFCNKDKYFFVRGTSCNQHVTNIVGRKIQVPCMGLKACPAFITKNNEKRNQNNDNKYQPRYICTQCFDLQGRHFFQRQGIGKKLFTCNDKHKDDTTQALELIGQWILNMAKLNNSDQKDELLTYLSSTLSFFDKTIKHEQNPPSLLFVKTAFQLGQVNLAKIMESDYNLTYKVSKKFGENLGTAV
ncbi:hypothetical protein C2G38_2319933 [Gigaspora rosea]|uniref:Uncharacterized protein n=1 Tax=Gigaspora rosea TaxID=44941 RepID=A0A397V073_9GLOM|nr:hypothetical protein C2G38_2319933 [Gigaspora rosea]